MPTPTNHTHSSLFDFDALEPDPSLEQNSSIEESNIFDSIAGGEASGHTRYSSSALSSASGFKSRGYSNNNNNCDSILGPVEEEPEALLAIEELATTTAVATTTRTTTSKTDMVGSILKPSPYSNKTQEQRQEQGEQQKQQQQQEKEQQQRPNLEVGTEFGMPNEYNNDKSIDIASAHPFSPTMHTSNQTPATCAHLFSPTMHTSNQTSAGFKRHDINVGNDFENTTTNHSLLQGQETTEVDRHGAERTTAWVIHLALIFFCGLVVACTALTFAVIQTYGFFTLTLMVVVIGFCAFLACFVDSTILSKNPKLRPVRQQILTVVHAIRRIIEDEYQMFVRDWKEEVLMITQGGENYNPAVTGDLVNGGDGNIPNTIPPQQKRKKSKIFKLVKPFLGLKKKLFKAKGRRRQNTSTQGDTTQPDIPFDEMPSYKPPVVGIV